MKNVKNNAAVFGNGTVGGFIGFLDDKSEKTSLSFDGCENNGNISGHYNYAGGFVGYLGRSVNTNVIFFQMHQSWKSRWGSRL